MHLNLSPMFGDVLFGACGLCSIYNDVFGQYWDNAKAMEAIIFPEGYIVYHSILASLVHMISTELQ